MRALSRWRVPPPPRRRRRVRAPPALAPPARRAQPPAWQALGGPCVPRGCGQLGVDGPLRQGLHGRHRQHARRRLLVIGHLLALAPGLHRFGDRHARVLRVRLQGVRPPRLHSPQHNADHLHLRSHGFLRHGGVAHSGVLGRVLRVLPRHLPWHQPAGQQGGERPSEQRHCLRVSHAARGSAAVHGHVHRAGEGGGRGQVRAAHTQGHSARRGGEQRAHRPHRRSPQRTPRTADDSHRRLV
mmetsp:Transcript_8948/g.26423  ORF Transcript_8948/g.26423 Transcript_8948/m.26423 type:complete len:241 (+) Transcript_8948:667-1389(+)